MANVICPQCGERLDIPSNMLGGEVRCGDCQTVFTAPPDRMAKPRAVPRARRADDEFPDHTDAYRNDDDRPRRGRKRRGWLWVLAGGMALLTCCCGGFGYLVYDMMSPDYVPFTSADARFSGVYPGPPVGTVRTTGRGMETVPSMEASRSWFGHPLETFFVAYFDLTAADRKKGIDKVLDELADGLKKSVPGSKEVMPRIRRVHEGHEAVEVGFDLPDGKHTLARIIIAHGRAYIVGVTGPGQPGGSPWVEEYLDAFRPTAPADAKADDTQKDDEVPSVPKKGEEEEEK